MITKFKTNLGSKPLGNHKYIKIAEINTNLQKKELCFLLYYTSIIPLLSIKDLSYHE